MPADPSACDQQHSCREAVGSSPAWALHTPPAMPTPVSRRLSHAFRPGCKGSILLTNTAQWDEPNADERERAMGCQTGATAAPCVLERQRRESLGRCIDANTLQTILAIGVAWGTHSARAEGMHAPCDGPR
jgi:hypothetical protein